MWGSFGALGRGRLGAKLGEQIAVLVADRNACEYCLAAHTMLGKKAGATAEEMAQAQAAPGCLARRGRPERLEDLSAHHCINHRLASHGDVYRWMVRQGERTVKVAVEAGCWSTTGPC